MKKCTNSIIGAILSFGITVFLASCLNPIGFDPAAIQLKVSAEVSGEIDVRSSDYAILWVINRTRSVDVTNLKISQEGTEGYPKTVAKPAHASTYASYHRPTDKPYRIDITFGPNPEDSTYPSEKSEGSFSITEKYMPKAGGNYVVYLYRAQDGQLIVVEDELITRSLDPGDTENPAEPPAAEAELYPLIVRNVTADANASYIDFALNSTTLTYEGPKAKDEYLNYLGAGQYQVTAGLYKTGDTGQENLIKTPVKNLPIIKPNDSQSWHTLYLWIYKTKSGGYGTTTTWPPNPNDAADVSISDVAGEGNGLLKIINKSESGDVIKSILLDSDPIAFGVGPNPSFIKDMEWTTVLSPGLHTVAFMPSRQTFHGITLSVQINEGEVTTLSYYDRLADPDLVPPDEGNGSGLIKVINNSTGVVYNVDILNTDNNDSASYYYETFTPPSPINYNNTGRIGVVGSADFPITAGTHYLVMVELELPDGYVVIQRRAALLNQVVEIVINEEEIRQAPGSQITLVNGTNAKPVQIVSVMLFNQSIPSQAVVFSGATWSPAGYVNPSAQAGFRVNSSTAMPITNSGSFSAAVTLYGNGMMGTVVKPVGSLYNVSQTITITDSDVPTELVETFTPVTGITGIPPAIESYINSHESTQSEFGFINLNGAAIVQPADATVQGPISWALTEGQSYVTLNDGVLRVKDTADTTTRNVTVKATIAGATGTFTNKTAYTESFGITLNFTDTAPPDIKVDNISGPVSIDLVIGDTVNLNNKVTINPYNATVNGVPVTAADINWNSPSPTVAAIINSSSVQGVAAGTVTVTGTIPAARTGNGDKTVQVTVRVTAPRPTQRVVRVIRAAGTDTVTQVVFVPISFIPTTDFLPVSLPQYCQGRISLTEGYSIYGDKTDVPLFWTGQTGIKWPETNYQTFKGGFKTRYPEDGQGIIYRGVDLPGGEYTKYVDPGYATAKEKYVDVTIPFGPDGSNKYFVFFIEGDGRVRGTSNGKLDPDFKNNYYFYVDLDKLPDVKRNGAWIVPLIYDSYHNIGSVGQIDFSKTPPVDLLYATMLSDDYK